MAASFVAVLAVMAVAAPAGAASDRPLRVVATLSTFADLVKQIGGEEVGVSCVASPRFNPHFIEPKPSDVLRVKKADLFVHGGLDLEVWRQPLVTASANPKAMPGGEGELDLSRGIALLEMPDRSLSRAEGDIHLYGNPHFWTSPENGKVMAQAIFTKLAGLDPARQGIYRKNLEDFLARLAAKENEWKAELAPYKGKEVIAYHNEWLYLTEFAGLKLKHYLEPKPGIPPTPRQIAFIEEYIRAMGIPAVIRASYNPPGAVRALEKKTGVRDVLLCQNVGELPEAKDYFSWMDYNVHSLAEALRGN